MPARTSGYRGVGGGEGGGGGRYGSRKASPRGLRVPLPPTPDLGSLSLSLSLRELLKEFKEFSFAL